MLLRRKRQDSDHPLRVQVPIAVPVLAGIPSCLCHEDGCDTGLSSIRIDQIIRNRIIGSNRLSDGMASGGNNIVPIQHSFDVQPVIANV